MPRRRRAPRRAPKCRARRRARRRTTGAPTTRDARSANGRRPTPLRGQHRGERAERRDEHDGRGLERIVDEQRAEGDECAGDEHGSEQALPDANPHGQAGAPFVGARFGRDGGSHIDPPGRMVGTGVHLVRGARRRHATAGASVMGSAGDRRIPPKGCGRPQFRRGVQRSAFATVRATRYWEACTEPETCRPWSAGSSRS